MCCPKCGNTLGFVFGTCVDCGWNSISSEWRTIKVNVEDLPLNVRHRLVERHARVYEKTLRKDSCTTNIERRI